jgi:hypothetical protein
MPVLMYREVQSFKESPLCVYVVAGSWIVLLAFMGLLMWNWSLLVLNPWPAVAASVFVFITTAGILFLVSRTALVTEVRNDGVFIQYRPFHFRWKRIGLEDLREVYVRTYRPLLEYGGWGIRYGFRGMAYNVFGNRGVQFEFARKGRLMIGSQRPEEFLEAVQSLVSKRFPETTQTRR